MKQNHFLTFLLLIVDDKFTHRLRGPLGSLMVRMTTEWRYIGFEYDFLLNLKIQQWCFEYVNRTVTQTIFFFGSVFFILFIFHFISSPTGLKVLLVASLMVRIVRLGQGKPNLTQAEHKLSWAEVWILLLVKAWRYYVDVSNMSRLNKQIPPYSSSEVFFNPPAC